MPDVDEGKQGVDATKGDNTPVGDKHPETVPWTDYVGIKEKFTRVEGELKGKVQSLEEQLKKTVSTEEHTKATEELKTTKEQLGKATGELDSAKEKTLAEKRDVLVKKGVSEDKVKDLSEKELDHISEVLGTVKAKPDMGGGGGGQSPTKAKDKMHGGFETLHPTK